jgi:hypothetical protein
LFNIKYKKKKETNFDIIIIIAIPNIPIGATNNNIIKPIDSRG